MITPLNVAPAISKAMSKDTTWRPDDYKCPEWGQCGNVAALIHWWFGGKIVEARVVSEKYDEPHYWNTELPNIGAVDYTRMQFKYLPKWQMQQRRIITFEELINEPWKQQRFASYRRAFANELGKIIDNIKS